MKFVLQPWQLLLITLAGWINQQQQDVIKYLRTENRGNERLSMKLSPFDFPDPTPKRANPI